MQPEPTIIRPREAPNPFAVRLTHEVDCATVAEELKGRELDDIVVDLRRGTEFRDGHIPGAMNVDVDEVVAFARRYPKTQGFITSCYDLGSMLSTRAADRLTREGYRARELLGGWKMWTELGHPVEKSRGLPSA